MVPQTHLPEKITFHQTKKSGASSLPYRRQFDQNPLSFRYAKKPSLGVTSRQGLTSPPALSRRLLGLSGHRRPDRAPGNSCSRWGWVGTDLTKRHFPCGQHRTGVKMSIWLTPCDLLGVDTKAGVNRDPRPSGPLVTLQEVPPSSAVLTWRAGDPDRVSGIGSGRSRAEREGTHPAPS